MNENEFNEFLKSSEVKQLNQTEKEEVEFLATLAKDESESINFIRLESGNRCGFANSGNITYVVNYHKEHTYKVVITVYYRSDRGRPGSFDKTLLIAPLSKKSLGCSNSGGPVGSVTRYTFTIKNETTSSLKLTKSEAVQYLNNTEILGEKIKVSSRDVVFSNKNNANEKWWFEPNSLIFKRTFFLLLNDQDLNKLYVFKIPVNTFSEPTKYFYLRKDKDRLSVTIEGNDIKYFQDCLHKTNPVKFKNFLVKTINY